MKIFRDIFKNSTENKDDSVILEKDMSARDARHIFHGGQFFEIGDLSLEEQSTFTAMYMGVIMDVGRELTLCVCMAKDAEFIYAQNEKISVAYIDKNELYVVKAHINEISETQESDAETITSFIHNHTFIKQTNKFFGNHLIEKFYIVKASVLTQSKKHQRRRHFRISAAWNIHFRLLDTDDELSFTEQKWLAEKMFEFHHGYFKMKTVDISGGGFKSFVRHPIHEGTEIACIIEAIHGTHEKDNVRSSIITGKIIGCTPNKEKPGFFIRAQFTNISNRETDFIVKNIITFERNNKKRITV